MAWMKFPNDIFRDGDIFVMCNMDDYPIPANADADETRKTSHNIISALRQLGSVGTIIFLAFHDDPQRERDSVMDDAGLFHIEPRGYNKPGQRNLREAMMGFLACFPRIEIEPYECKPEEAQAPIYIVIAEVMPPGSDLYRTLKCLKRRGIQIVLLNPVGGEYMFPTVESVFENGKILDGESLVSISKYPDGFGEQNCNYRYNPQTRSCFHVTDFMPRPRMRKRATYVVRKRNDDETEGLKKKGLVSSSMTTHTKSESVKDHTCGILLENKFSPLAALNLNEL